jgi:hypothetical protein
LKFFASSDSYKLTFFSSVEEIVDRVSNKSTLIGVVLGASKLLSCEGCSEILLKSFQGFEIVAISSPLLSSKGNPKYPFFGGALITGLEGVSGVKEWFGEVETKVFTKFSAAKRV